MNEEESKEGKKENKSVKIKRKKEIERKKIKTGTKMK